MTAVGASGQVKAFIQYLQRSPSPYHAVEEASKFLLSNGFNLLDEALPWALNAGSSMTSTSQALVAGGKYFLKRNGSSLIAFSIGKKYNPCLGLAACSSNPFKIIAAHTDSPCLKVRPNPKKVKESYEMLAVSTYGGGLWHTWFDRDLSIAGKIIIYDSRTKATEERLVDLKEPLLRIPTLAIHLDRSVHEGFKFNTESQLIPVLSNSSENLTKSSLYSLIKEHLGLSEEQEILNFDLSLYDTQGPSLGGLAREFLYSARLDNLLMSFTALSSLVDASSLDEEEGIRMICLFDHEEVGSTSIVGADSHFLMEILNRLTPTSGLELSLKKSFLISADVAHALHPNYSDKYELSHAPRMNEGLVIKYNVNQRYMTNATSASLLKSLVKKIQFQKSSFPNCQEFTVKNDCPCGSTIGPFLASKTGIMTIDVGIPILSMHSIREMMGVHDISSTIHLFTEFFESYV